ncbi:MAG: hypothetical protein NT021_04105 [Sphingobacteriales bacterium]|nr:hypothetical protein [Sphingobacteriales bacterium]
MNVTVQGLKNVTNVTEVDNVNVVLYVSIVINVMVVRIWHHVQVATVQVLKNVTIVMEEETKAIVIIVMEEGKCRFSVIGDAGATYSKDQVKKACLDSSNGSIIICHMNHPKKDTAEGLKLALPELIKRGIKFVKLEDYSLK